MNNKIIHHSKELRDFLILCALLLAVLFSSCIVRKTLYAQLDIPVVKSLNTSKATLAPNSVCKTVTGVNSKITYKVIKKDVWLLLASGLPRHSSPLIVGVNKFNRSLSRVKGSDQVPLYILYQNRKIIT